FPTLNIPAFCGLGGRLDGAVYSGAGKNVTLASDSIFFNHNSVLPVRGVDVAGAPYWEGATTYNGSYTVGDGGTSVVKGLILDAHLDNSSFRGTVFEAAPGSGYKIWIDTLINGIENFATFQTTNTVTGVEFVGPMVSLFIS